jgi:hypothetical protein
MVYGRLKPQLASEKFEYRSPVDLGIGDVALEPDVILACTNSAVAPLQQATRTVPIVFTITADPVGRRLRREPGPAGRQWYDGDGLCLLRLAR